MGIEVFQDRQALDRQNAQSDVARVLDLVERERSPDLSEWTVWETSRDAG